MKFTSLFLTVCGFALAQFAWPKPQGSESNSTMPLKTAPLKRRPNADLPHYRGGKNYESHQLPSPQRIDAGSASAGRR